MRVLTRLRALLLLCCFGVLMAWSGTVSAAATQTDLKAEISSKDPTNSSLKLTNVSDRACQVATTAAGTVAVTKVVQGGKLIKPLPIDSSGAEDAGYLLQDQLKTLKPGETIDLALPVYKLSKGYILHATTWSLDGGAFSAEYPLDGSRPLQLELSYNLPVIPVSGAPVCVAVFASNVGGGPSMGQKVIAIGLAIVLLAIVFILITWFWRRKKQHHRKAAKIVSAAVITLLGLGVWWYNSPPAYADVVVPPELQATYDGCIATFNANSDITGDVLRILNDPANHFEIVHTHGRGSDMTGRRSDTGSGGIFTIYWNPDDHHSYAGTGGSPDACSVLFHELYHALDQLNSTFSRDDCAGSGIETKEVMATRAQNQLRERLGLPPRSHYGDRPLPSGDCSATTPTDTSCTGEHCGETNGDPHMHTFDGLRYDFQAAGEFVVSRNKDDSFAIQARQEPWTNSRVVSINTVVALKVGKDRVEIRSGQAMSLLLNGKKQDLKPTTLPGGGELGVVQGIVTITWTDGSKAYIRPVGSYGLALAVEASDAQAGKLEGLLGDADGESKNDLQASNSNKILKETHEDLYPGFADSWRVTDKTSLFTYDKGKRTDSYTIRNFPDKLGDPKSLPGYAAAEAFCKNLGISDPEVLANCALDMALTGRPEFARAAARSQIFTAGTNSGGTTWQLDIKNPGDSASVAFDAKQGEKIFADIPTTTLPSQCGRLRLLGPDAKQVADGCIINGKGNIDGTVLPATGTYTISLAPGGPVGSATLRLLRITDKSGNITPDGDTITVKIDKPGVVGRYTFTAQAGQRAYVAVPSSTLESQCGGLRLLGPDGHEITNGCIINHVGNIDTAVLPTTGQYTIVVDPNDTITGQAQLQLIFPTAESKAIAVDGATLTTNLKKPGSIALFTFDGTAGKRVFIDLPTSELPSQCGLLVLRAPDGHSIGSGCVINHKGNLTDDGILLPETGQYTIVLDPNASDTGKTTIRLRSR